MSASHEFDEDEAKQLEALYTSPSMVARRRFIRDRLEFQFGFEAVQCRHNTGNDGDPMDGCDGPDVIGEPPDVTVDVDKVISWISVCCGPDTDPGDLSKYIDCVSLDEDDEVDTVGLTGIDTDLCDVYYKTGDGIFKAHDGSFDVPGGDVSDSDFCGQTAVGGSDDDEVGSKMEGEDIVALKDSADLEDC